MTIEVDCTGVKKSLWVNEVVNHFDKNGITLHSNHDVRVWDGTKSQLFNLLFHFNTDNDRAEVIGLSLKL